MNLNDTNARSRITKRSVLGPVFFGLVLLVLATAHRCDPATQFWPEDASDGILGGGAYAGAAAISAIENPPHLQFVKARTVGLEICIRISGVSIEEDWDEDFTQEVGLFTSIAAATALGQGRYATDGSCYGGQAVKWESSYFQWSHGEVFPEGADERCFALILVPIGGLNPCTYF